MNSRDIRNRDKYTREKMFVIETLLKKDKTFLAPPDYAPPIKKKKIYLPDGDSGESALVGLILGPGGKTHKDLEKRSKCKIFIRGKGANDKSKIYNRKDNDEREPLHVSVESAKEENLEVGVRLVNELLDPSSDTKKNQLIEIAAIRGFLKDDWCEDCGEKGHRRFECPNKMNTWKTVDIRCEVCGQTTHPTRDCPMKNGGANDYVDAEDELDEFLTRFKEKKEAEKNAPMITNYEEIKQDSAFDDATKQVVNALEKEAPGILPKEIKDKINPYVKKADREEAVNDRVVALIDDSSRQIVVKGEGLAPAPVNPIKDLHDTYKDDYGKLIATEAVNFYDNVVKPREEQAARPPPPPKNFAASQGPPPSPSNMAPIQPPASKATPPPPPNMPAPPQNLPPNPSEKAPSGPPPNMPAPPTSIPPGPPASHPPLPPNTQAPGFPPAGPPMNAPYMPPPHFPPPGNNAPPAYPYQYPPNYQYPYPPYGQPYPYPYPPQQYPNQPPVPGQHPPNGPGQHPPNGQQQRSQQNN